MSILDIFLKKSLPEIICLLLFFTIFSGFAKLLCHIFFVYILFIKYLCFFPNFPQYISAAMLVGFCHRVWLYSDLKQKNIYILWTLKRYLNTCLKRFYLYYTFALWTLYAILKIKWQFHNDVQKYARILCVPNS